MTLKIFVAKDDGACATCGQSVKGKRSLFNLKKQLVHADCQWKDKIRTDAGKTMAYRPDTPQGSGGRMPIPPVIEQKVRDRVKLAKRILQDECPEAIETHDYAAMLAEVLHELYSEEAMIRIQRNKEANIDRVRT